MYIISMRWVFLLFVLFVGCAGSKQPTVADSPRCNEIAEAKELAIDLKMPYTGKKPINIENWSGEFEECPCIEVTNCNNEQYCITIQCPGDEPIRSFARE